MDFVYISKSAKVKKDNIDVSVSYIKTQNTKAQFELKFSFSASTKEKSFKSINYIVCAYADSDPAKIWFKGVSDENIGYKLAKTGGKRLICSPFGLAKVVKTPKDFVGNYELFYEPNLRMWYIDRNKKIGGE